MEKHTSLEQENLAIGADMTKCQFQGSPDPETIETFSSDLDLAEEVLDLQQLFDLISEVASRRYVPRLHDYGNTDFQVTRGLLGISL
mgnify:CR=1 FL=1